MAGSASKSNGSSNKNVPPVGEVRQSQMLTTAGAGAMLDLPDHAVIVSGLEFWRSPTERIHEPRLEAWIRQHMELGNEELKFYAPPRRDDERSGRVGVAAFQFPRWFLAQVDHTIVFDGKTYRTRPLVHHTALRDGKYLDQDRKLHKVVPVRFVQACVRGHISDIDWIRFVRQGATTDRTGELWFDEGGAGNDFTEIFVRDPKYGNKRRPLANATIPDKPTLGKCRGEMPWLGAGYRSECDKDNRLLTRSASNAYFSQVVNAISIPDMASKLSGAIDDLWENHLQYCEDERDVAKEMRRDNVKNRLNGFEPHEVWAQVERRRGGHDDEPLNIRQVELRTLLSQPEEGQSETREHRAVQDDFYARRHRFEEGDLEPWLAAVLDQVVLVHRLREVIVQIGFSRFEAAQSDVAGELDLNVERAPLAQDVTWLPAVENRGEGIFFSLKKEAVVAWREHEAVVRHAASLHDGFEAWKRAREKPDAPEMSVTYVMLHSLAHLLITALSLECGYSASAIKERIYADDEMGYGILLYTGGAGSEGTLGGLVEMGKQLPKLLTQALEWGKLCSNDPVCAQHDPADENEGRYLHGAACHGCLLIAETSCERRNEHLDRALVVEGVMSHENVAFFQHRP